MATGLVSVGTCVQAVFGAGAMASTTKVKAVRIFAGIRRARDVCLLAPSFATGRSPERPALRWQRPSPNGSCRRTKRQRTQRGLRG